MASQVFIREESSATNLMGTVNTWLSEKPDIQIQHISYSSAWDGNENEMRYSVAIVYSERTSGGPDVTFI